MLLPSLDSSSLNSVIWSKVIARETGNEIWAVGGICEHPADLARIVLGINRIYIVFCDGMTS